MARDIFYDKLLRPILFSSDPELVHQLAHVMLHSFKPLLPAFGLTYKKDDLQTDLFGTRISNPIGLAAGFDKNASLTDVLGNLGFGYAEIGSVCARPHGGNIRPRLFRLPADHALINRLGLNGLGAEVVASRLENLGRFSLPIGINIAKTNDERIQGPSAIEDICYTFNRIKNLPVKYVTINTSCPNTKEGCLREGDLLAKVLEKIEASNENKLPILLKLSPDSEEAFIEEVVRLSKEFKVNGFVCGNTTVTRSHLQTDTNTLAQIGAGGLSGKPLKPLNLELTRKVARLKSARQTIIGVGGIETGQDVFDYLTAGAHLVQIYTGFVYRGPSAVKQICEELQTILTQQELALQEFRVDRSTAGK